MEAVIPKVVFYIFGFPITDTIISTWVMMALIILIAFLIRKFKPEMGEMIVEMIFNIVSAVMPEDVNLTKYLPFLGTLAIFLVFGNIFSVVPRMVSPTANLNSTAGLAILVFFAVHFYGIREKGLIGYLKDLANPIFMLPLEIVGQLSRTLSLAVRLFGNILSTDLIVAIIFSLIPFLVPLPLIALGVLTGLLQAYIFIVLASLFIGSAIEVEEMEQERRTLREKASKNV